MTQTVNNHPGETWIGVRIVFWDERGVSRPTVVVDRDMDGANRRAAVSMWDRMSGEPAGTPQRQFLDTHSSPPQWATARDVDHWLEAVSMELSVPASWGGSEPIVGDIAPERDRDVTVIVVHDRDTFTREGPGFVAGFDQASVEQQFATMMAARITRDPHLSRPVTMPDLGDPVSVSRWLADLPASVPQVVFTTHQTTLPATTATSSATVPGGVGVCEVWMGAVYWDGAGSASTPEFLIGDTQEAVQRLVAQRIHTGLSDTRDDPAAHQFLMSHPYPVTSQQVSDFLAGVAVAGPGTAYTYQAATIDVTDVTRPVFLASLTDQSPFDATLMIDTSLARLRMSVASALADDLADQPLLSAGREFLTRQGHPTYETAHAWLDAYQSQVNDQLVGISSTFLPATPPAPVPVEPPLVAPHGSSDPAQVMIDTREPGVWTLLNEGGIPDLIIHAFPPPPDPSDHPDTGGTDRYSEALQDWMGECLEVATSITHLPELRDRVDELEYLRDRVARLLARTPLPREPQPGDYLATTPSYEGEYDTGAYQWDHTAWQQQFRDVALARDSLLTRLITTTTPTTTDPSMPQAAPTNPVPAIPQARHGFPVTPTPPPPPNGLTL